MNLLAKVLWLLVTCCDVWLVLGQNFSGWQVKNKQKEENTTGFYKYLLCTIMTWKSKYHMVVYSSIPHSSHTLQWFSKESKYTFEIWSLILIARFIILSTFFTYSWILQSFLGHCSHWHHVGNVASVRGCERLQSLIRTKLFWKKLCSLNIHHVLQMSDDLSLGRQGKMGIVVQLGGQSTWANT